MSDQHFPTHVVLTKDIPTFGEPFKAGTIARIHSVTLMSDGRGLVGLTDLSRLKVWMGVTDESHEAPQSHPFANSQIPPVNRIEMADNKEAMQEASQQANADINQEIYGRHEGARGGERGAMESLGDVEKVDPGSLFSQPAKQKGRLDDID